MIGIFGFKVGYYLHMTHEPSANTLTWTLDYSRTSDIGVNCGMSNTYVGLTDKNCLFDSQMIALAIGK